jgi:hypothetical protein
MSEQIMWAVFRKNGRVVQRSVQPTKRDSVYEATGGVSTDLTDWYWKRLEARGYRCVRVRVTEVQDGP